jgi:GNAT superfamily N-acetyltransferase
MPGYRFCRSDDIPLLVAAHNACWVPHFGAAQAITVDSFKRGIREQGLWSSSCMVAFDGDEPIGVLIGAKRDGEANCVHRLVVKPGWERRGHGRHLLTSLADKAAILGPARLVAEIPVEWVAIRGFFERSGFVAEAEYVDFVAASALASDVASARSDLMVPIGIDELLEGGVLDPKARRAWCRTLGSLRKSAGELEGWAVATDRIEAYVVCRLVGDADREVVAIGVADGVPGAALLGMLFGRVQSGAGHVRIPMASADEVRFDTLAALGFRRGRAYVGYVARNRSA